MPALLALSFGLDIVLDRRTVLIGRHPTCDVLLDSLRVSRRHCVVTSKRGAVVVRDLGSTNGTWINGRRVTWGLLWPGDEMAIAHLHYLLGDAPTSLSPAVTGERPDQPDDESDSANPSDVQDR